MTISEKISHLSAINIGKLFDKVLKENEDFICGLNREQMYDKGVMNVKTLKKEAYAPSTIKAKRKAAFPKTEFVTLKWSGKFHGELGLIIFKDRFLISSKNPIWGNYLEPKERFGHALGLTGESKGELRDLTKDEMIRKIRAEL